MLPATKEGVKEIREYRRLILLYFRLCCYEVRSDLLARQNRKTWMHDSGEVGAEDSKEEQICTKVERDLFKRASTRIPEREWGYHYANKVSSLRALWPTCSLAHLLPSPLAP
jgi:hypothetical protein